MKNTTTLKNILGLNQEESAMLMGVTEGHWSMIAIGKRDLPFEATIKLGVLLEHLNKEKPISEVRQQLEKAEKEKMQNQLQQDYKTIQMKEYRLAKKIATIEKIRTECFAALEVANFLDNQEEIHSIGLLSESIRLRATKTLKQHDLYALEELQLKKESLEVLKKMVEKRMKGFQK